MFGQLIFRERFYEPLYYTSLHQCYQTSIGSTVFFEIQKVTIQKLNECLETQFHVFMQAPTLVSSVC